MQISLKSTTRKILFACCALLAIAQFVHLNSRAVRAYAWAAGDQQLQIQRAVALEPRNADYWYRLGRRHWLIDQDSVSALTAYDIAVQQNPHVAGYYIEIARVSLFNNDLGRLMDALENALRVDPTTPSVNWEAANLYLAADEIDRALPLIRNAAASWEEYRSPAIALCWQATHDVDRMAAEALPRDPQAYGEFMRYLLSRQEVVAADHLWPHFAALHEAIPAKEGLRYLDSLLQQHRVSDAVRVWRELSTLSPEIAPYLPSSDDRNQVVNSGFEQKILDGGFGWRITPLDKVTVENTAEEPFKGERSLAVTFDSSTTDNAGILQWVPLRPAATYSLSFAYKADKLEGAHGICVVVSDAHTGKPLLVTDEMMGSTGWHEISRRFSTGPSTDLVSLELKRPAGTLIRGRLFLDEVRMVKQ